MDNVERIKEKIDIIDLIGSYITLSKAGENFKGKCPFHNEKTASFMVSPVRQSFYCFGCGVGGDIFTFIERYEGFDFRTALKSLADRAGIVLGNDTHHGPLKDEKDQIYSVLEEATQFFEAQLSINSGAMKYLSERGLKIDTVKSFRIGFAPRSWSELSEHLKAKGYSNEIAFKAGLLKKKDDRYYDTFRSRIVFPISDSIGRVVAFSGRIFGEDSEAKYLNSPETPVFTKGEVLYGFDKAKQEIRKKDFSILVEGQFDLVMAHQSGFTNTVASSGTAFNEKGLSQVGRLTKNILLVFDADAAGIGASGRVAKIALPLGFNVKSSLLPKGSDPADVLHERPEVFTEALKNAKHIVDFYLELIEKAGYDERKLNLEVTRIVLPYVALLENKVDQAFFVRKISTRLKAPEATVWAELSKVERPPLNKEVESEISPPAQKRTLESMIYALHEVAESRKNNDVAAKIKLKLQEVTGKEMRTTESDDHASLFEMELVTEQKDLGKIADEILNRFELEYLSKKVSDLSLEIRKSEEEGNEEDTAKHLLNIQSIINRLDELKKAKY